MYKTYLLFIILSVPFFGSNPIKNYGFYDLVLKEAKSCKGPKRRDCAISTYGIIGKSTISCDVRVVENTPSLRGKVIGYLENKEIIRINLAKPCSHIFFMPLLKMIIKMTDNCVILKGKYNFTLDIGDVMNNYQGSAFVFGNWTYKSMFYNDECNFSCNIFEFVITPKRKV